MRASPGAETEPLAGAGHIAAAPRAGGDSSADANAEGAELAAQQPWQSSWGPGELTSVRFAPMGLTLELTTNSAAITSAAEACFRGYGPDLAGAAGDWLRSPANRPPDLQLRLFAETAEAPPDAVQPLLRGAGPYLVQASGGGSVLVVDRRAGFAFGHLSPAVVNDRPLLQSRYLEAALGYFLECRGFIGVHAAAVARGGRGLLLRGASGQGKTTLAFAAVRRGFQAIAEDVVWVETARRRWWGAPWQFHLLPDAVGLFPELAGLPLERQVNDELKLTVDLEAMRAGSTAPAAEAGAVVMLERISEGAEEAAGAAAAGAKEAAAAGAKGAVGARGAARGTSSRLVALSTEEAHRAWYAGGAAREREVPAYEEAVEETLRRGAWRLLLGSDLDAAVDLLESLLA